MELGKNGQKLDIQVSIIIINFFSYKFVVDAIQSIKKHTKGITYEIIVVDNSENEDEYAKLLSIANDIVLIKSDKNGGFGYGNNIGVKKAKGEYLLFLNADTVLLNNAILLMYNFLIENEKVGIVGPNLFHPDLTPNASYVLQEKNIKNETKSVIGDYIWKNIRNKNYFFNNTDKPIKIDGYVCGACLMIKKELFEELGMFDERIFMYAEESLLCYNAIHKANKEIYNLPNAKVIHFEGGTVGEISNKKASFIAHGNYIYYKSAFGDKVAKKYLLRTKRQYAKKAFICKILMKKHKASYFTILSNAYKEKALSIN